MKTLEAIRMTHSLSGRWTIPILLALKETRGRFTPLQHKLEISPSRLSDNLKKLDSMEIIKHLSPGERRHPLLPEYQLTEKGLLLQEAAKSVHLAEATLEFGVLSEKLWNWPVLLALNNSYSRFQMIRNLLEDATPRILSARMDDLHQIGLIDKLLESDPRPGYRYLLQPQAIPAIRTLENDLYSLL